MIRRSMFPSNRIRRSKADSMLQAARAPVKISVAVECKVSNSRSLTGVIDSLLEPARKRGLHRLQPAGKKMIGARNQRQVLWLSRRGGRLNEFRLRGVPIVVATQKKLGNAAAREEGIIVKRSFLR